MSPSPEGWIIARRRGRVRVTHPCGLWFLETDGLEWAFCSQSDGKTPEVLHRAPAPLRNLRESLRGRGLTLGLEAEDAFDLEAYRLRVFATTPRRKR